MKLKAFFEFVEIRTKLASVLPFCFSVFYSLYFYKNINIINTVFMFISLIFFDMVTTAVNNYSDYKNSIHREGYNFTQHNPVGKYNLSEKNAGIIIFLMLLTAVLSGIILVLNTDFTVLLIGIISFDVGISYSYGPIPISRTPLGEIFSAFFMGFVIVFLGIYINMPDYKIPELIYIRKNYNFYLNLTQTVKIFLLSFSNFAAIFNIMLSNNICDCEDDEKNKRYTLVYYIGKEYALKLYKMIYFMIYAVIIFLMISKVLPYTYIIIFFTLYGVLKNIKKFEKIQTKKDTFVLAVKNHFLINTVYLLILIFGILVPGI